MIIKIFINNIWVDFDIKKLESIQVGKRNKFLYNSQKIKARCGVKFICVSCNKEVGFSNFNLKEIHTFSYKCGPCSRREFNIKTYGVGNPSQREEIKQKKKQTMLKNYGTQNGFNLDSVKNTMIKKYGVDHASKSKIILNKSQETIKNKNNGLHTFQTDDFKKKSAQTKLNKYGDENYSNLEKARKTWIKKYGVDNPTKSDEIVEKIKENNNDKYGVDWPIQLDDIQEKSKLSKQEKYNDPFFFDKEKLRQTNFSKYGVGNVFQSESIKSKIKKTNLEKYGVESALQDENIKNKVKQTNIEKYGVNNPSKNKTIKQKIKETHLKKFYQDIFKNSSLTKLIKPLFTEEEYIKKQGKYERFNWLCLKCNNTFEDYLANGRIPLCTHCYPREISSSLLEKEIVEFLKSLNIKNIIENDKSIINPYEIDIYLPNNRLAIEFNGLYWHSELNGKDKNYHLSKTKKCLEKNVKLIHIFEDEWLKKQDIVKSLIRANLGIFEKRLYARKCEIKETSSIEVKTFLDENHLQGFIPAKINLGLFYNNEMVSLLTLGESRFNKSYDWEILRFVNKLNHIVIGGFSKLLKNFLNKYLGNIITYSDARLFDGHVYLSNGFKNIGMSNPAYFYVKGLDRFNRQRFQKHKLEERLEYFDPNLTEWENMKLNGWDRIWDCGNYIFELRR